MGQATIGTRGGLAGINDNINMLKSLSERLRSDASLGAIEKMQSVAFDMIDEAVYGSKYGKSLSQIFSRTRPKFSRSKNAGTPVKSGRLQNALTIQGAPYGIYSRNKGRAGNFSVSYGADPRDPAQEDFRYFPRVENLYGFFADGLDEFDRANTMKNLSEDIAKVFTREVRNRLARQIRSGR